MRARCALQRIPGNYRVIGDANPQASCMGEKSLRPSLSGEEAALMGGGMAGGGGISNMFGGGQNQGYGQGVNALSNFYQQNPNVYYGLYGGY